MNYTVYKSPLGAILLGGDASGIRLLNFQNGTNPAEVPAAWTETRAAFTGVVRQLDEYFDGNRRDFDLALRPQGTVFQKEVWSELERIPYGTTISYSELAERIKRPKAVRAVGSANGANPIPLIIPCHRVIGADGSLTGYGGGLEIKERLLAHEGALLAF